MALTPEEEKQLREEIRQKLQQREQRMNQSRKVVETSRRERLESTIRNQIKEEEEERFFSERGYVKHKNRYGEVEWLKAEEAEERKNRRRSSKSPSRSRQRQFRLVGKWLLNALLLVVGVGTLMFLLRYNPVQEVKTGKLAISSDMPGARIYFNGAEKQMMTPDTLMDLPAGRSYFVTVYRPGFTVWPPIQRVTVEANKTIAVDFELKSAGLLGKINITANSNDFQLFVDGLPMAASTGEFEIPQGYHIISAIKPGYLTTPIRRQIVVKEGETISVDFQFAKRDDLGNLSVSSNQSTAFLYLDNRLTGIKANGRPIPVPAGVYEVRLRENGYKSHPPLEIVTIKPGETRHLSFHLQPSALVDTLDIQTRQEGLTIVLNGKLTPLVTPFSRLILSEGDHYLNLIHQNTMMSATDFAVNAASLPENNFTIEF